MKESPLPFRQIEWWLMTILIFLIILTNLLGGKINLENLNQSTDPDQVLKYFAYLVIPITLYVSFYLLHMKIIPIYRQDGRKVKMVFYSLLVFFGSWFLIGIFYVNAGFGQDLFIPFYFFMGDIY
jgi:hypothetical protein